MSEILILMCMYTTFTLISVYKAYENFSVIVSKMKKSSQMYDYCKLILKVARGRVLDAGNKYVFVWLHWSISMILQHFKYSTLNNCDFNMNNNLVM